MYFVRPESLTGNSVILDVRSKEEYVKEHLFLPHILIEAAFVEPDDFMEKYNPDGDKRIDILCTSGGIASEVAEKFERAGYSNVAVIIGGIIEAEYEGLRIIKR